MMSRVIVDHGGYIEKNTGDGLMAVFGPSASCADDALDAAVTCFCVLRNLVNPYLTSHGIGAVAARIGIDHGEILIARIGLPTGGAHNDRNFLTAIGPAANIASRLQGMAGTNGVCVGERVRAGATGPRVNCFQALAPPSPWPWGVIGRPGHAYWVWTYTAQRTPPLEFSWLAGLLGR